ncbi:MAG: hypothetical protein JXA33_03480 [Anaerolineae bacterium]|nr:hypothetical protein [Anaerolineae bacterium]
MLRKYISILIVLLAALLIAWVVLVLRKTMLRKYIPILIVLLTALFLTWVVSVFGNSFLDCAWGNVAINLISDAFFVIVLAALFVLPYTLMTRRIRRFFGIVHQDPIQIYISSHEDDKTKTRKVITAEEYEVADELRTILYRQFPDFIPSLARLFGVDLGALNIPDIVIKSSPLEVTQWPDSGSLILIGGPTCNKFTDYFLQRTQPWLTFDDNQKKFFEWENRDVEASAQPLDKSHKLAVVERLKIDEKIIIVAFGYGEVETAAAVRHLAQCWSKLAKKDQEFAQLLRVDGLGQIQVEKEYS